MKYNLLEKLKHVYLKNPDNNNEIQYIWDIEYFKDYIRINNYIWQQEKVNSRDKRFFISTINFSYDKNGAIREKAVHVDYGNHSNSSYERYFYQNNKVINVLYFEGIEFPYYTNADSWEYKGDVLLKIIQNEVLRRKLYRKIKNKFFSSDYKIIEIK